MAISNAEMVEIYQDIGFKSPITGGPAGSLKSPIAQTLPFEMCSGATGNSSALLLLNALYITQGQTITNINYVTATTAASGPTHLWFALYDDGRGSSTAGQLALLGQTADQGSAAINANTNIGLSLILPWTTQYSGIYYAALLQVATVTAATFAGNSKASTFSSMGIASGGTGQLFPWSAIGTGGLTNQAPALSGALALKSGSEFAYVS